MSWAFAVGATIVSLALIILLLFIAALAGLFDEKRWLVSKFILYYKHYFKHQFFVFWFYVWMLMWVAPLWDWNKPAKMALTGMGVILFTPILIMLYRFGHPELDSKDKGA